MQNQQTPEGLLGERVRLFRQGHGWTQATLAERMREAGWSWQQTTAAKTEAADRPVRLNEAAALATVLGTTLDQLVAVDNASRALNDMFHAQSNYNRVRARLDEAEREVRVQQAEFDEAWRAFKAASERHDVLREGENSGQHQETS